MKSKLLNLGLIVTSLIGYLEWGKDNHRFLFQLEMEVLSKLFKDPLSVIHPFTLLPLIGQILLFITIFQKKPSKLFTYLGMGGIGILLVLMFAIGIMSKNLKILASTIPFLVMGVMVILHYRKTKMV